MGGGRKHKSGSSSSHKSHHHGKSSQHHSKQQNHHSPSRHHHQQHKHDDDQLTQSLETEVVSLQESSSFISWKLCFLLILMTIFTAAACLLAGLSAGNAISIQYYQHPSDFEANRRITTMDTDIQDVLKRLVNDDVQELPPLDKDRAYNTTTTTRENEIFTLIPPTIHPTLCPDGETMGFSDWNTLKSAIHEANRLSAENFLKYNQWIAQFDGNEPPQTIPRDISLYYERDFFFVICPYTTLKARKGPIFINAENIVLECNGCTIQVGASHLAFGSHAKNVLVRGITFRGATSSSLTFYQDGADAAFEDCYWYGNAASGKSGAVADVNSTSSVVFYRCEIDDANNVAKYSPRGGNQGLSSSLSIRS